MNRASIFSAILVCLLSTAASAQDTTTHEKLWERVDAAIQADPSAQHHIRNILRSLERGEKSNLLRSLYGSFFEIAPDGRLTPETIETHKQIRRSKVRANIITRFLTWDLNGDGTLSDEERQYVEGRSRAQLELLFNEADSNSDKSVSFEEMRAQADAQVAQQEDRRRRSSEVPFILFDVNFDGAVSSVEISEFTNLIAERDPQDASIAQLRNPRGTPAQAARCAAPKPAAGEQLVVLSSYEGSKLSTVSIAGLDDVTQISRVVVEAGKSPLYLYVSAHSNMIWEITGETKRVARLVVQRQNTKEGAGAGVIGISSDKVTFVDPESCSPSYFKVEGGKGLLTYRRLVKSFGRDPDVVLSSYAIGQISVPSGKNTLKRNEEDGDVLVLNGRRYQLTPRGPRLLDETEGQLPSDQPLNAKSVYRDLYRYYPGGVFAVPLENVVAPGPATQYDVMPQEAGLLQLLLDERLEYKRDGYYLIKKLIERFSTGLYGAHSTRFVLAEGVTMPAGTPGHSSVFSAETGDCHVRSCRR